MENINLQNVINIASQIAEANVNKEDGDKFKAGFDALREAESVEKIKGFVEGIRNADDATYLFKKLGRLTLPVEILEKLLDSIDSPNALQTILEIEAALEAKLKDKLELIEFIDNNSDRKLLVEASEIEEALNEVSEMIWHLKRAMSDIKVDERTLSDEYLRSIDTVGKPDDFKELLNNNRKAELFDKIEKISNLVSGINALVEIFEQEIGLDDKLNEIIEFTKGFDYYERPKMGIRPLPEPITPPWDFLSDPVLPTPPWGKVPDEPQFPLPEPITLPWDFLPDPVFPGTPWQLLPNPWSPPPIGPGEIPLDEMPSFYVDELKYGYGPRLPTPPDNSNDIGYDPTPPDNSNDIGFSDGGFFVRPGDPGYAEYYLDWLEEQKGEQKLPSFIEPSKNR